MGMTLGANEIRYVRHVAWSVVRDADAVDDVAQSALCKAWAARERWRGDCALTTWLHHITLNEARQWLRRRRMDAVRAAVSRAEMELVTPGPHGAVAARQVLELVGAEIELLPRQQRDAVVAMRVRAVGSKAAARAAGCTVGAMQQRCAMGQARVRSRVGRLLARGLAA